MKRIFLSLLIFFPLLIPAQLTWEEVDIPMSDGEFLAADIYLPDGWTTGPTILIQTPYWKNWFHFTGLPLGIGNDLASSNYAFVVVDWRGFFGSATAAYAGSPTRGEDGYDVVEWIATQDWSNGKIGTWGPSALGRIQFQTAKEQPPHLVCIVPQVASPLYLYDEYFPNGAARTEYIERLDELGFGMSASLYSNPYDNGLWTLIETANDYPEDILVPCMMIGGWYDHNVETMLQFFPDLVAAESGDLVNAHKLVMGPWTHGGSGSSYVGSAQQGELYYPAAVGWSDSLAMAFLDYHLRELDNGMDQQARVTYFQMGDDAWQEAAQWPTVENTPTRLFLHNDFSLSTASPVQDFAPFVYDPQDPCPTVGGPTLREDLDQGPFDQVPLVESREDVIEFTTAPLTQDMVLQGNVKVHLRISTDVSDTDVAVRLCDVYPDGRSMQVNNKIYRLRFLNGFEETDQISLAAGEEYEVEFLLPQTSITFKAGHRVRIDISGSIYPQYNRNMNTGGEMYPDGNGDTLVNPQVAHTQIHFTADGTSGSWLDFPFINAWPAAVVQEAQQGKMQLRPVPAGDVLQVEISGANGQGVWTMLDLQGQLIATGNLNLLHDRIDVQDVSSGIYVLEVVQDARVWRERWIKQ